MIARKDIEEFFELEAEATKKKWEAMMKLPIKDRIRKRKAVKDVFLNREFNEVSDEGYNLLKVSAKQNLSDFKEGEYLILHRDGTNAGIKCRLVEFDGDDDMILDVFPPDMPADLTGYYDTPLILDKNAVDLRSSVYTPFLCQLPLGKQEFWENLLLNKLSAPQFSEEEKCEEFLQETESSFKLQLLPMQREAIKKSMMADDYYLIQGPPGTGKSFVLGIIILEEMFDLHHNVVVIGPNHLAINNVLEQMLKLHPEGSDLYLKVGQKYNRPHYSEKIEDKEFKIHNVTRLKVSALDGIYGEKDLSWLIGLTPHSLYTSRARGLKCDTLIIDEAAQMSIPLALMGMIKAKKIIFAGDHKQLPPIISSEGMEDKMRMSAFQRLVSKENCTMLDTSFRMCEPICDFVSDLFYDGKLKAVKKGVDTTVQCGDPLISFDNPVVLCEVEDTGEQFSEKEAKFIAETVAKFIAKGVDASDIAVLSPFRAQATTVRRHIRKNKDISEEAKKKIVSETIDKMQGQERKVIIYSLVSGDEEYMNEMAEFLYNPNKMNVAFSRAKSKLIIVGNLSKIKKLNLPEYPHIRKMMESEYAKTISF